jgi:type II secretory pathway pseudopilin PulG
MAPGFRRSNQRGTSLLELTVVMTVTAVLGAISALCLDSGSTELTSAHQEIVGSLYQAFTLARARGTDVKVALGKATGAGEHLPVQLGRKVKWGKPDAIPLPPDMDTPVVAAKTGEAHPIITVTPRHTTLASAWFLNDGQEALCMRLSGQGHLQVLRWRRDLKKWTRV